MIKAVLFDFDGVIVDTERARFVQLNNILKRYTLKLKEEWFKDILGLKTDVFLRKKFSNLSENNIKKISDERRDLLKKNPFRLKLYHGIDSSVITLSKQYCLAVVTGTDKIIVKKILSNYNIDRYFNVLITGDMFSSSKPDSECYELALKKLRMKPDEVIVIEDSKVGILAAKKLNCIVFGYKNSYNKEQLKDADKIFSNHDELKKYLIKIMRSRQ